MTTPVWSAAFAVSLAAGLALPVFPARAFDCSVMPVAAKFQDGQRVKVIDRQPHRFSYEIHKPDGTLVSRMTLHDLFPLRAEGPKYSSFFEWSPPLEDLGPLATGMTFERTANIRAADGKLQPYFTKVTVGATSVISVSGCDYRVFRIETTNIMGDAKPTFTTRYFHEPSRLTLKTIISRITDNGTIEKVSEFHIVEFLDEP